MLEPVYVLETSEALVPGLGTICWRGIRPGSYGVWQRGVRVRVLGQDGRTKNRVSVLLFLNNDRPIQFV